MSTGGSSPLTGVNMFAIVGIFAAVLFAPVGIVFGVIALQQIKQTGERGREIALAAIWIGIGIMLLSLLTVAVVIFVTGWIITILSEIPR